MNSPKSKVWTAGPRPVEAVLIAWPLAAVILVVCSPWCWGQDYNVRIGWVHYEDDVGREILYDFSTGSMDQSGVVTIPGGAVLSRPPDESGTTYFWEPLYAQQSVELANGIYRMSIPQPLETPPNIPTASIVVDGSVSEWTGVSTYIADRVGDSWRADVDLVKLAYSNGGSRLNILIRTAGPISQDTWYRLFLDRDLDGEADEPGDFQIDFAYQGSAWDVVSQGWNSEDGWDWYPVQEQGVVIVSGQYIEASVDAAAFGLPGNLNVYGRTMQSASPYATQDRFTTNFMETSGFTALGAANAGSLTADEWEFSTRIRDFENVQAQRFYGVDICLGSSEQDDLEASMDAGWFTGDFEGTHYDQALIIGAQVENGFAAANEYAWDWEYGEGGGLLINGLDPATTVLDLKIVVSNAGRTASFYYRTNNDDPGGWQLAVSHTVPVEVGRIYGVLDTLPAIGMSAGVVESAAHPPHDWNGDGIVSIVGDVPPFVNCVYFSNCPGGVDPATFGDCNHDGIISIVGDVPCFVQCVYFADCP